MPTRLAIAAEGQTDQRVIDNILTGFFSDRDAPVEIRWDRPQHDEPGGWLRLLNYLRDKEYRAAFQFNDFSSFRLTQIVRSIPVLVSLIR